MRLRGLTGARDEFNLAAIVQNLKTLANYVWRPLFAAEDEAENARFLSLLTKLLGDPPANVELFALLTIRSEIAPRLLQIISERGLEIPDALPLLPLPQTSYRDVILEPLKVIARRGQMLAITSQLAERLVADAIGADALPLLAFTLSHLYQDFGAGGTISVEHYEAMGGVAGSIELAFKRALSKPGDEPVIPVVRDKQLACMRSAFIPWLARVNLESGLPMRRVARMAEFPENSLAMVKRLIEARLLVADRQSDDVVVEIAHESLLRQWPDLSEWLKDDAEDLKLIESVERAAREWARNDHHRDWLDYRGARLHQAERVATREDFRKRLGDQGLAYVGACRASEKQRRLKLGALVCSLLAVMIAGAVAWRYQRELKEFAYWFTQVRGYVLTAERERALNEGENFRECADCPTMISLPSGSFMMGSPAGEGDMNGREYPLHKVTIGSVFAVGKSEVTFAEWDACALHGPCDPEIASEWGRGQEPVINVTWDDAKRYVDWLSRMTSKPYRLLSESEYEYAARAGKQTAYPWGNSIGNRNAQCGECDAEDIANKTAPVGSFTRNRFGLYDIVGNVFEWIEDCRIDVTGAAGDSIDRETMFHREL
jgi:formylglycine-generating enzyme required for sulfatase activity